MAAKTLKFEQTLLVAPGIVLHAFTNASMLRRWLCDQVATAQPRPGGRLYMSWNSGYYMCGEYTAVEPDRSAAFTWFGRGNPGIAQVRVQVEPQNGATRLTLEHTLPDDSPAWEIPCQQAEKGWNESLSDLKSVLETGMDPRFVNRPMLGITFSDFNAEIAGQLGVPTSEGVRLDIVIEGMGAHAAGLRSDDVIVQVDDVIQHSFTDITKALTNKRAGDTLKVIYYRGSERHETDMVLSRRPLPEVPWSVDTLAAEVRRRCDEVEAEMSKFFANISEAQADYRPSPDAWTIKEVLAHLLQGERYKHFRIDETVGGFESWNDDWGGNLNAHVRATVAAYPTLLDLLAEIRRGFAETVAFYANLPAEFLHNNKAGYWYLAHDELEDPYHFHTHLEQMNQNLEAARQAGVS